MGGGHSWGALESLANIHNLPQLLISPIPSLLSLIETNFGDNFQKLVQGQWHKCLPDAPFPYLHSSAVESCLEKISILESLKKLTAPVCIIYGEREHPSINAWIE